MGHSMGCQVLCSYLALNKPISDRLAGVIWSAPFWGIPDFVDFDEGKKMIVKLLAPQLDELLLTTGMPTHKVCRNRTYMRLTLTGKKAPPFTTLGMQASFLRMLDLIHASAKHVDYPYILVLADKDIIVSNKDAKKWHSQTKSKVKQLRLMPNAYHELSKEPNNHILFEASLKFMGERLIGKAPGTAPKPFGEFNHATVRYYKPRPLLKKRKFWIFILVLAYLIIGIYFARKLRLKRSIITWPLRLIGK